MVGAALDEVDERGRPVRGDTLLVLINAGDADSPFVLPSLGPNMAWVRMLDTKAAHVQEQQHCGSCTYPLEARTLALFVLRPARAEHLDSHETAGQP
jgi:glycogen operon protein